MTIGFLSINSKSVSYSVLFEKAGHECLFFDEDTDLIYNLNNKIFLYEEPELQVELSLSNKISGNTDVTEVIKNSDVIFSFVDNKPNTDGTIDITEIFKVIEKFYLCTHLDILLYNKKFVLSSVLNPGDSKLIYEKISQFGLLYGYLPNFLTEGRIYKSLVENEFSVLGTNSNELSQELSSLFRQIRKNNSEILIMSPESAELVKFGISSIVASKIVISNIIGDFMTTMGLENEISMVLSSISKDARIGKQNLNYGLSYGGPHLGKEVRAFSEFAKNKKLEVNLFEQLDEANKEHVTYLKYYYMTLNSDKNKPFIIDSITYKKGTEILEDSQRLRLCLELLEEGYFVNVTENLNVTNNLMKLSQTYNDRLKFFKKGSNPDGVKIKL